MNTADALAALNVTYLQLLDLMQNAAFPQPASSDGYGNFVFNSGAIVAFAALMSAAAANGWQIPASAYASANWSELAASSPGKYATSAGALMRGASRSGV